MSLGLSWDFLSVAIKSKSNTGWWVCIIFFNSQLDLRDPHQILPVCKPGSSSEPLRGSRSPGTQLGLGRWFFWLQTWRLGRSVEVFGFGKDARTWKAVGVNPCTRRGRMTQQVSEWRDHKETSCNRTDESGLRYYEESFMLCRVFLLF